MAVVAAAGSTAHDAAACDEREDGNVSVLGPVRGMGYICDSCILLGRRLLQSFVFFANATCNPRLAGCDNLVGASGAALNAMIASWLEREWPKALSLAFNGASVGGIVFVPLWMALIAQFGFLTAAILIGPTMIFIIAGLAYCFLRHDRSHYGLNADGDVVRSAHNETAPARPRAMKSFRLASRVRPARYLLIRNRVVAVASGS
jgi:hypothetical protein